MSLARATVLVEISQIWRLGVAMCTTGCHLLVDMQHMHPTFLTICFISIAEIRKKGKNVRFLQHASRQPDFSSAFAETRLP